MIKRVLFRVDSSAKLGAGHLVRCLSLADHLMNAGIDCLFACRDLAGHLCRTMLDNRVHYCLLPKPEYVGNYDENDFSTWAQCNPDWDAQNTCDVLRAQKPFDWVVVDHYAWQAEQHQLLQQHLAPHCLVIDDLCNRPLDAHIIVDSGEHSAMEYQAYVGEATQLLLGRAYMPIAKSFLMKRRADKSALPFTILVSCGATDPRNDTRAILDALMAVPVMSHIQVICALASKAPFLESARRGCQQLPNAKLYVDADIATLASRASMALGSAGSGAFERSLMGCPNGLFLAGNDQLNNFYTLINGAAAESVALENELGVDKVKVQALVERWYQEYLIPHSFYYQAKQRAYDFIDGLGSQRIYEAMKNLHLGFGRSQWV